MPKDWWEITDSVERPGSGKVDHTLNVRTVGGAVRVIERPTHPHFVCMACMKNACEHTRFVRDKLGSKERPAAEAPPHTDDDFRDGDE
jgi:hypothetical protein